MTNSMNNDDIVYKGINRQKIIASDKKKKSQTTVKKPKIIELVEAVAGKNMTILDFGCGYEQPHVNRLTQNGFKNVHGHDFSCPNPNIKRGHFDIVYANDVLHILPSDHALYLTLMDIAGYLNPTGVFYCNFNYPRALRKTSNKQMKGFLKEIFSEVFTLNTDVPNKMPLWGCRLEEDVTE